MSGFSSPNGLSTAGEPKQISSRLLNMKFMQRAAASDKSTLTSAPHTPRSEPPLKRRRTGDHVSLGHDSPSTPVSTLNAPSLAERLPNTPLSRVGTKTLPDASPIVRDQNYRGGEHLETEWILDITVPTTNGHLDGDVSDSEVSDEDIWSSSLPIGRQTYGAFKTKKTSTTAHTSAVATPQSQSKSARRNAATKRSAADADLSSVSGSDSDVSGASEAESGEVSGSESDAEPDTYSSSRVHQANKKSKAFTTTRLPNSKSILSSAKSLSQLDAGDFLKFDESSANGRAGSGSWNSQDGGVEKGNKKRNRQRGKSGGFVSGVDRSHDNNKQNGYRGSNSNISNKKKKKRKTM